MNFCDVGHLGKEIAGVEYLRQHVLPSSLAIFTLPLGQDGECSKFVLGIHAKGEDSKRRTVKGRNLKKLAKATLKVSMTLSSQVSLKEVIGFAED